MTRSGPRGGRQIALQQTTERLLDYLVGNDEYAGWHRKAERLSGLEVAHEFGQTARLAGRRV
jgi:hypothetical protein